MNCPVCQRSLAPTLSICPTCGAMMNDTVREEVEKNITSGPLPLRQSRPVSPRAPEPVIAGFSQRAARPAPRPQTGNISAPKTSPTLVEFNHKNKSIPEWRLQLQNAVQQRRGSQEASAEKIPLAAADHVRQQKAVVTTAEVSESIADPRVANAIRRIT